MVRSLILSLLVLTSCKSPAQETADSVFPSREDSVSSAPEGGHAHPDSARIVTEDIDRFWAAYDAKHIFPPDALRSMYLDPGTVGLQDFARATFKDAGYLFVAIDKYSEYYESTRASMLRARDLEPEIRDLYARLSQLYPDAIYPDVYFVVGSLRTGGYTSDHGIIIGTEIFGLTLDAPLDKLSDWLRTVLRPLEAVPDVVAHEAIHFQQKYPADSTLLSTAIQEGVAEYLGQLISADPVQEHYFAYGREHEAELWCEFKAEMAGSDKTNWFYQGSRATGRPADLGYFVGHQIAQSFALKIDDEHESAIKMLNIQDVPAFLQKSGYAERFNCN